MLASLGELAARFGCELLGDPAVEVERVGTLDQAGPSDVAFLANPAYRSSLPTTRAGAVILAPAAAEDCPTNALLTPDPYGVYARVAALLHPRRPLSAGIHASAVLEEACTIPASCEVGPGAVIGARAVLGERVRVGAGVVIGADCSVGDDTELAANVTVYAGVRIGARCLVHAGAVLGSDGFGFARDREGRWTKVPQVGRVIVGDDVEIGANTTIDRGAIDDTLIGNGVRLDNQIQVGHNVVIGEHTAIAALTGISGSTRIGARCMIAGQVGIAGHITIADDVVLTGRAIVTNSIRKPGAYGGGGPPADELSRWRRNVVRFGQLEQIARRLRKLERAQGQGSDEEAEQ